MRILSLITVCLLYSAAAWASAVLVGDTSRPEMSTFIPGETITLTFDVTGLIRADGVLKLLINIANEFGKTVEARETPVRADASGHWNTSFTAPNSKLGFYRVNARLSNGTRLEKLGSRQEGYLTYCVVPDPKSRPLYDRADTRFGMSGGFSPKVPIQPYLGIRWMYGDYAWRDQEPNRAGEFAEKRAAAEAAHEKPVDRNVGSWRIYSFPTPFFVPAWAAIPETKTYVSGALTSAGEKAWDAYCRQLPAAVAQEDPSSNEHIYQITWEPVFPWGFKGTDEQLIRIYEIAYRALHAVDPKACVIGPTGGGIKADDLKWNAGLLKKGLGKYLDGYAIHPYHPIPPEPEKMVQHARELREIVRRGAGHPIPIFGTEQGYATKEDPSKELDQARGLLRQNLIMLGEGFRFNMAFYIADYPTEPGFGYYYNLTPKIPHGSDKISPKPIAPAYAAQSFLIEGHRSAGAIEWLGETAWGYAFERKDSIVLALWDYGTKPRQVTVPVGVNRVEVYDWMGNKKPTASPSGMLGLTLSQEPIYVTGASPRLWSADVTKPMKLQTARLSAFPGGKAVIRVVVTAAGRPIHGRVLVEPDTRLGAPKCETKISLRAGAGKSLSFDMPIAATCPPGAYPVKVMLRDGTRLIGATGLVIAVAPPVEILSLVPTVGADGSKAIEVILLEAQGRRANGKVTVELKDVPGSRGSRPFALAPKGKTKLVVPFSGLITDPATNYHAMVTVTVGKSVACRREFRVNFLEASSLPKAPVIDGDLTEWEGVPVVELKGAGKVVRCPEYYTGPDDLTAAIRFAWDESALYLAAEVADDVFVQDHTGFMTWLGDCIQIGFDLDPDKKGQSSGNLLAEAGTRRHSEIDLALTADGPQAYRTLSFDPTKYPIQLLPEKQCRLAITRQDRVSGFPFSELKSRNTPMLTYEAAIPWETLGASKPVRLHQRIGIALAVNDLDDPKQPDPTALGLFGGIAWYKDPDRFGVLTLGNRPK